jgi:protein-S-isoprenylcysteine O-methyltransferase Ste14
VHLAHLIAVVAVLCGAGSVALLVARPLGSFALVRLPWPDPALLAWDALLCLGFFVQHSGMIRPGFRARLARVAPPPYHRAIYSIASGIALAAVALLWQPSAHQIYTLAGPLRWAAHAVAIAGLAVVTWGFAALRSVDMFGVGPLRAYAKGAAAPAPAFVARGPYRWVRHPLYFGVLLLFWSNPDVTADRLLFMILWTLWIYAGTKWEESDLLAEFGAAYEEYRRRVPMLIPRRAPTYIPASPAS